MPLAATAVICTKDRPDDFARCLASVLESDLAGLDVLVIDQSDAWRGVREICEPHEPRVRYVHQDGSGLSRARNLAMGLVKAPYVLFTDDDCTVSRTWAGRMVDLLDLFPQAGCVFGSLLPTSHDPAAGFVPAFRPAHLRVRSGALDAITVAGCGANFGLRVSACRAVGHFDEALGAGARFKSVEDIDFASRLLRRGFEVLEDPAAIVHHWGFRDYASGSARRYMRDVYYGEGARQARDLRAGHLLSMAELAYRAGGQAGLMLRTIMGRGRPTGAGRLKAYAQGFVDGARAPLDGSRGLFAANEPTA